MKRRKFVNAISIFIIVLSVLTIATVAVLMSKPFKEKGKDIILPGTTSKVTAQEWNGSYANFLICGIDKTNLLTDVIMVVGFDNTTGQINILQIPRDTYAGKDIPSHKYNAIYGHPPKGVSGLDYLKAHIQRDFGITINYYGAITTDGLDKLVDSVGGVDLYVPVNMNYDDRAQNLHIHLKKGYQHLNGNKAEQFVRERKAYVNGDLGRLDTLKIFLSAFAQKLKQQNLFTLTTKVLPTLLPPSFKSDMSTSQMLQFGLAAKKVDMSKINVMTVPGDGFRDDDAAHTSYFGVYKDQLVEVVNRYFMKNGQTLTKDDIQVDEKISSPSTMSHVSGQNFQNIYDSQQTKNPNASASPSTNK